MGKLSAEAGAGGGIINNDRNLVDTRSPAYKHWNWNREKGFVTVRAMMVHKKWSWALPLDARRQVPLREIGKILKEHREAELRSPEGPHNVLSLALPQPVPNKDTKATRGEEPGPTANRGPPPYKMKMEAPPAYMVKQGRQDALATIRRTIASPRIPVVSDSNPLGLPWDADGQPAKPRLVTIQGDKIRESCI